ncbi:hypothetical protein B296_00030203 [Ensete ventricosum]|uniref:IBB domain-containing protein n=1 Tax=Ensete ventricosum TaxID=4639 RepID=A0A426ZCT3_ENSVE|nr:hypothetical protein B296_00030203 [Ensete ventricosum]
MSLRPSERAEVRRNKYKVAVDAEEGRRRREDNMVEIRKNRREESLQKKRREGMQALSLPQTTTNTSAIEKKLESLPAMVAGVYSDESTLQLEATTQFRKLLSIGIVKPALPALERLIHLNDEEVLTDACWALSYLSDGTNDKIQAVLEAGVCPRLVELLLHPSPSVLIPALRTVGNIVTGDDVQTQAVITAGIIAPLVHLLQTAEFDIKKEAAWAISNATSGDPRIVTVCLEGLENILKVGEAEKNLGATGGVNLYAQLIDEAEGVEKIENLQSHDNTEIYEKAVKILEAYWMEEEDDAMPTGDAAQTGFQFGNSGQNTVPSGGFNFS